MISCAPIMCFRDFSEWLGEGLVVGVIERRVHRAFCPDWVDVNSQWINSQFPSY